MGWRREIETKQYKIFYIKGNASRDLVHSMRTLVSTVLHEVLFKELDCFLKNMSHAA